MTEAEIHALYRAEMLPQIAASHERKGKPDYVERAAVWNQLLDHLVDTGHITQEFSDTIDHPEELDPDE